MIRSTHPDGYSSEVHLPLRVGDCDFVLLMRYTQPATVVPGGGHVISLTHPTDVNGFIRSAMAHTVGEPCD